MALTGIPRLFLHVCDRDGCCYGSQAYMAAYPSQTGLQIV